MPVLRQKAKDSFLSYRPHSGGLLRKKKHRSCFAKGKVRVTLHNCEAPTCHFSLVDIYLVLQMKDASLFIGVQLAFSELIFWNGMAPMMIGGMLLKKAFPSSRVFTNCVSEVN